MAPEETIRLAYVAGPYRASTKDAIELNIQSARATGLLVARRGWMPVIPHSNTAHFDSVDPTLPESFWLDGTMAMMRCCDAVVLAPGWEQSQGTLAEIAEAHRFGIQVYERVVDLPLPRCLTS